MGQKWPKMAQKWPKNDISISGGPSWDQKRTQNEKKWPKKTLCGPKWPEMGQKWAKNDSKWPKNGPKKKPRSEIAKKLQPAFFNFWRRGTVSEISAKKRNFADFGPWAPQKGKYPYFSKFLDETRSDCPGHQKNDPDLQRRQTLKRERRNGRFSVGPKIAKRAKNPKKKVKNFFEISRKFLKN